MVETIELMSELFEVDIKITINPRSKKFSRTRIVGGRYEVLVSPTVVQWFHDNGYNSYRYCCTQTAYGTLGRTAEGMDAVQVHALHEVAHILVDNAGHDMEGRPHGEPFLDKFAELINFAM